MSNTILLSANSSWYLFNFRRTLIQSLVRAGWVVYAVVPDDEYGPSLFSLGCRAFRIPIDNRGANPLRDLVTQARYFSLYRRLKPRCVLQFTIKPVVYGSLAARLLKIPVANTITGLGSAFLGKPLIRRSASWLLRRALVTSRFVIFQNHADSQLFSEKKLVCAEQIIHAFGSGVDLQHFTLRPYPSAGSRERLTLIARMLRDKGIEEFVACAKRSYEEGLGADYILVGPLESPSVGGIPEARIRKWSDAGYIQYYTKQDDIRPWIAQSTCVVLPSYREGMARTLMEACAMGRPVITTNVPGCRDIVDSNKNGFLCEARNVSSLFKAISEFTALSRDEKEKMGRHAHRIAQERFSDLKINEIYLSIVQKLSTTP